MSEWALVVLAGLLYAGSVSARPGKIQAFYALASLLFFLLGMGLVLNASESSNQSKPRSGPPGSNTKLNTKPNTSQNARPNVSFGNFNRSARSGEAPWCVGTNYAIAYKVNDHTSDVGPATGLLKSLTHTQPILTVAQPPPESNIEWYRGVEGVDGGALRPLSMVDEVRDGVKVYIDKDNKCDVPFKPIPELRLGGCQYGGAKEWMKTATQRGEVPWCVPTVYYARYVNRPTGEEYPMSEPSQLFQSSEFTVPCLNVAPRAGCEVFWYRQVFHEGYKPSCEHYITLPLCAQGYIAPGNIVFIDRTYSTVLFRVDLDFTSIWNPSQSFLKLCVEDFIDTWNRSLAVRVPDVGGRLSRTSDGRFVVSAITNALGSTLYLYGTECQQWWQRMGFSSQFPTVPQYPTNAAIIADTLPLNDAPFEYLSMGSQLVDPNVNPCRRPNPRTQTPKSKQFSNRR
jgi:hypothetical protein